MNKLIILHTTLQEGVLPLGYKSEDASVPDSIEDVIYPVNAFLASSIDPKDKVKVILVCKEDPEERYTQNLKRFTDEFDRLCGNLCQTYDIQIITTSYGSETATQKQVIKQIADAIDPGCEIISDITYGSKDFAILLMSVLSFATKHLDCIVDYILYREVFFKSGVPINPILRNFAPLLHLTSLAYTLNSNNPEQARNLLDTILSY